MMHSSHYSVCGEWIVEGWPTMNHGGRCSSNVPDCTSMVVTSVRPLMYVMAKTVSKISSTDLGTLWSTIDTSGRHIFLAFHAVLQYSYLYSNIVFQSSSYMKLLYFIHLPLFPVNQKFCCCFVMKFKFVTSVNTVKWCYSRLQHTLKFNS